MQYDTKQNLLMGLVQNMKGHHIFTPFELVEELLELTFSDKEQQTIVNSRFAILFNAEFVFTLINKFSVQPTHITYYGDCKTKKELAENWNCNYGDAYEFKESKMSDAKKFDFVIGNPPYQDSRQHGKKITGNGPLWVQFTKLAIERLEKDGTLAFVIPDSVLAPTFDMMGSRISLFNDLFKMKNLKYVNTNIKEHFPEVGINPIAFILENNTDYTKTNFNNNQIDISNMYFCPKDDSKISWSIHKKILSNTENKHKFKMRWNKKVLLLDDANTSKTEKHIYPVLDFHSFKEKRWSEFKDPDFDMTKIMVTYVGKYQCVADKGNCGAKKQVSVRFVQDNESLEGLYSFYNSSLIHWVMNSNKWTQYLLSQILNYIPTPNLQRIWSDQEIFDHFRLSSNEVQYVINALNEKVD